jgi:hypothetical protein
MKDNYLSRKKWHRRVLAVYMLTVSAALAFDFVGDRSFGALMLSTFPISIVAMAHLLVGPWCAPAHRPIALMNWIVGATIILIITLVFSSLGPEQAKTGELIFIYTALILAFPLSLVLPFAMALAEPMLRHHFVFGVVFAWVICLMAGGIEWWLVCWLLDSLRRRKQKRVS